MQKLIFATVFLALLGLIDAKNIEKRGTWTGNNINGSVTDIYTSLPPSETQSNKTQKYANIVVMTRSLDEDGKSKRGHWSGNNQFGKVVVMRRSQESKDKRGSWSGDNEFGKVVVMRRSLDDKEKRGSWSGDNQFGKVVVMRRSQGDKEKRGHWSGNNQFGKVVVMRRSQEEKEKRGHWSGNNQFGKVVVMRRSLDDKADTKRDVFDLFDNPIRKGDKTVYWRRSSENTDKRGVWSGNNIAGEVFRLNPTNPATTTEPSKLPKAQTKPIVNSKDLKVLQESGCILTKDNLTGNVVIFRK